jgi:signal transduction histidine kinase/CheY-like chemotaxis protein/HPt (histidine-containing phosphotransfer) domain-containing protein
MADTALVMRFTARGAARHIAGRLSGPFGQRAALTRVGAWLLLAVVLAIVVTVWDLRRATLADALVSADNLAIVLAEQTSRSVQAVDVVLRDIQDYVVTSGVTTPEQFRDALGSRETNAFLRGRVGRLPQVNDMTLIAADGTRVANSLDWPVQAGNLADREYARHFAARDDRGLFISEPTVNRATHISSMYFVRRVNGPNGVYLGMVIAAVPLQVFSALYQSINLPGREAFSLMRRDGTMVVRHPDPIDRSGMKMPAGSPWYGVVALGGGHYESPGVFDGTARLIAVRPLRDYPLVLTVAMPKSAALMQWRREAELIAFGTVGGTGGLLLLLRALERQFRRSEDHRAALQTSEARLAATSGELETALASMDQGLVMVDAVGTVVVCNPRAIELLGLPAGLMAARPRFDAVAPLRSVIDGLGQSGAAAFAANSDPPRGYERAQVDERTLANGRLVEVRGGPLASGSGWMATFDDITARRHAEQQVVFARAESRAKSGFLAMMSHEIRTPMNGVLGLAGALLDTDLSGQQRTTVTAIQDSGNSLLRILNDILDFSKLDAGQMQLEDAPFSPATLTEDPISLLGPQAAAKGLRIDAICDDGLPAALLGDSGRLRQVLLNLVSNAIKFTGRGAVTIRAACPEHDDTSAAIVWTVTDTGIGIPADRIAGLFGEFFQADASITRRFGGSGLGLAISKRLIEQMGGTIAVRSREGEGSTFEVRLRLPIAELVHKAAAAPVDAGAAFEARLRQFGRSARILLAEDNPTNQFVFQQLLRGFEVQVDLAANGLEAVRAASGFPYDVICMDMRMPEMDGLAATRAIRAMGGHLATVPIIALTANAFPDDVSACYDAGMTGFLAKPVSKQSLLTVLLPALGQTHVVVVGSVPSAPEAGLALDRPGFACLKEDIGEDGVAELVATFEAETRARFILIADRRLDRETLTREVHSLKGAAGTACAMRLTGLAEALETRLKRGEGVEEADVPALIQAFEAWRDAVHVTEAREAVAA